MTRSKLFVQTAAALALMASGSTALAQSSSSAGGSTSIVQQAGVEIVQDVLTRVDASLIILGTAGDSVSVSVPSSVSLSSPAGDSLTLGTASQLSSNSLVLSEDTVSVNIGAIANGETATAPPGTYGGVLVVLAQYN